MKKIVFCLLAFGILSSGSISALSWDDVKEFYNDHTKEIWITVGVTTAIVTTAATALVVMRYKRNLYRSGLDQPIKFDAVGKQETATSGKIDVSSGAQPNLGAAHVEDRECWIVEYLSDGMPIGVYSYKSASKAPADAKIYYSQKEAHEMYCRLSSAYRNEQIEKLNKARFG